MDTATHKILDWLDHLWPYITGLFIVLTASARLAWFKLTNKYVTKDELKQCRLDVQEVDDEMLRNPLTPETIRKQRKACGRRTYHFTYT